jgi:predicted phosphodiesterase
VWYDALIATKGKGMRCLILSDIHSNLEALEAAVRDAGQIDQAWCLGDVVGYGPDPNACVKLLRSLSPVCIAGNHDWATLGKLDLQDFNPDARDANLWNRRQLTADNLAYLEALPEILKEGQFTMAHGSPRHPIWEYIIYNSTARVSFDHFDTRYCLVGHTHSPTIFRLTQESAASPAICEQISPVISEPLELGEERMILNPGSVGQPRDGDPRASYAILDLDKLTVEHRRIEYDIEKTQAKMMEYDLPLRLVLRLKYGW